MRSNVLRSAAILSRTGCAMTCVLISALETLFLAPPFMIATAVYGPPTMLQTTLDPSTSVRPSVSTFSETGTERDAGSPIPGANCHIGPGVPGTPAAGLTMFNGSDATYFAVYLSCFMFEPCCETGAVP